MARVIIPGKVRKNPSMQPGMARPRALLAGSQGSRSEGHSMEKDVTFWNESTGTKLAGTLMEVPKDISTNRKAVILCHGFAGHRNGFHFPKIAKVIAQRNKLSSLRFDFSGNGDSEGTFEYGNYKAEAMDIRAAVEYLRAQGMHVCGLVGHSKGADSVLIYASIYDDVHNVVNIAGRFDMKAGVTERFGEDIVDRLQAEKHVTVEQARDGGVPILYTLTKWSMQDRLALDMKHVASKIRLSDVLTVHGTRDCTVPFEDALQWGKYIANHELKVCVALPPKISGGTSCAKMGASYLDTLYHACSQWRGRITSFDKLGSQR